MNLIPISNNQQTNQKPDLKIDNLSALSLSKFDNQLNLAESDLSWIQKEADTIEKERLNREDLKKLGTEENLDQQLMDDSIATSFLHKTQSQQQINKTKSVVDLDTVTNTQQDFLKGLVNSNKVETNKVDSLRFQEIVNSNSQKAEITNQAIHKKVLKQKAHLINPTLENLDDQTVSTSTDVNKDNIKLDEKLQTNQNLNKLNSDFDQHAALSAKKGLLNPMADFNKGQILPKTVLREQNSLMKDGSDQNSISQLKSTDAQSAPTLLKTGSGKLTAEVSGSTNTNSTPQVDSNKTEKTKNHSPDAQRNSQIKDQNIKSLIGNIKLLLSNDKNLLTMKLNPEHLGKLEIKLKKDGDNLTGILKVESKEAKSLIESQLATLKQDLKDQGINVNEFVVQLDQQEQGSSLNFSLSQGEGNKNESSASSLSNHENGISKTESLQKVTETRNVATDSETGLNIFV